MQVVCAWCSREISQGPGPVSHGICPACSPRVISDALGVFEGPTLLLGRDLTVRSSNADGWLLLDSTLETLAGRRLGEALGCMHAERHACGDSAACTRCTLREAVVATSFDGKDRNDLVARIPRRGPDGAGTALAVFSARKVEGGVLLTLSALEPGEP